jgi:hypothetical protein
MLLVKTKLDVSHIHGIGLFAEELIPRNTVVWKFHPLIDLVITENQIDELAEDARTQIKNTAIGTFIRVFMFCAATTRGFQSFERSELSRHLPLARKGRNHLCLSRHCGGRRTDLRLRFIRSGFRYAALC